MQCIFMILFLLQYCAWNNSGTSLSVCFYLASDLCAPLPHIVMQKVHVVPVSATRHITMHFGQENVQNKDKPQLEVEKIHTLKN